MDRNSTVLMQRKPSLYIKRGFFLLLHEFLRKNKAAFSLILLFIRNRTVTNSYFHYRSFS